jgi:DNA-binding winged helix-turn-helix (wHTH) protein
MRGDHHQEASSGRACIAGHLSMREIFMTSPANTALRHASPRHALVAARPAGIRANSAREDGESALGSMPSITFRFGRYQLSVRERLLLKEGLRVHIGGRAFDLLLALVERAGETVSRQELFERVWPDVMVSKVNLRVHIAGLRKALEDGRDGNRFIVSVAGRGYRFVATAHRVQSAATPAVCVVDLAGVGDPAHVVIAVAGALGCEVNQEHALNCVLGYLRYKRMLLAFDNCEHVAAAVTQFIERLFMEAPLVQILIGSRTPLPWPHTLDAEE